MNSGKHMQQPCLLLSELYVSDLSYVSGIPCRETEGGSSMVVADLLGASKRAQPGRGCGLHGSRCFGEAPAPDAVRAAQRVAPRSLQRPWDCCRHRRRLLLLRLLLLLLLGTLHYPKHLRRLRLSTCTP